MKARIHSIARARARQRMLQSVPSADVVVVNPIHIAVALRYDMDVAPAPIVVAMGERKLAERIKALARESGVPVVENIPVARALHGHRARRQADSAGAVLRRRRSARVRLSPAHAPGPVRPARRIERGGGVVSAVSLPTSAAPSRGVAAEGAARTPAAQGGGRRDAEHKPRAAFSGTAET